MKRVALAFIVLTYALHGEALLSRLLAPYLSSKGVDTTMEFPKETRKEHERAPEDSNCWPSGMSAEVDNMATCCWYSQNTCCNPAVANGTLYSSLTNLRKEELQVAASGLYDGYPNCYYAYMATNCMYCAPYSNYYIQGVNSTTQQPQLITICQSYCYDTYAACSGLFQELDLPINNGGQLCQALSAQYGEHLRIDPTETSCFSLPDLSVIKYSNCAPDPQSWYVDAVNGSDSHAGTEDEPFESLEQALSVAHDRDRIFIKPGIYKGTKNINLAVDNKIIIGAKVNQTNGYPTVLFECENSDSDIALSIFARTTIVGIGYSNCFTAIYAAEDVQIVQSAFSTNTYAISLEAANFNISGSTFVNNVVSIFSLTALDGSNNVTDSQFIGTSKERNKTSAILANDIGSVGINNCVFKGLVNNDDGAVISGYKIRLYIHNSTITNCNSRYGQIELLSVGTPAVVSNCTFYANTAVSYAGAIYVDNGSKLNVADSIFASNNGSVYGGAIYTKGETHITHSLFVENVAATGGAIACASNLTLSEIQFTNNQSPAGSAYYCMNGCNVKTSNVTFTGDSAYCPNNFKFSIF